MVRTETYTNDWNNTDYANSTSTGWSSTGWGDTYYIEVDIPNQKKIKKLLKKMLNEMCKSGWINHIPYYKRTELKPISLRGVRYDGRGWAN